ncbi:hypothetical protein AB835_12425 [Candidatus Endobugula sertula]|uniref:Uncharacterized protein n=1 Tax=Candidatus Endobugula sertula TaxID=62101 RepID=A0A1D2QMI8_9GAMM|nr:hypothetical protein AB835_12425 [Candidatus Endobugula sertula]
METDIYDHLADTVSKAENNQLSSVVIITIDSNQTMEAVLTCSNKRDKQPLCDGLVKLLNQLNLR